MELYIEKEFLDNFYLDYSDDNSIHEIVKRLITRYGNKKVFIDIDDFTALDADKGIKLLEQLKYDNELFSLICDNDRLPIPVKSIKEHLFSKCNFTQTLVFTNEKQEWFIEAQKKGALCFSFNTYMQDIKTIVEKLHFKIDLSEKIQNWSFIGNYDYLNFNSIVITDNYILSNKTNQYIIDNLIPLLKNMVKEKVSKINIDIITLDLNPISEEEKHKKEKAKKRHKLLNSRFAKANVKFKIFINIKDFNKNDFHDRNILTNFSILDSGKGFNLFPFKKSNSQIISETIFEKFTYDRLNRIKEMQSEYLKNINNAKTSYFLSYP